MNPDRNGELEHDAPPGWAEQSKCGKQAKVRWMDGENWG